MEELKFGNLTNQQTYEGEQQQVQVVKSPQKNKTKHDDQAVPALALKAPIDFNLVTEDDPLGAGIGDSNKPDQN